MGKYALVVDLQHPLVILIAPVVLRAVALHASLNLSHRVVSALHSSALT